MEKKEKKIKFVIIWLFLFKKDRIIEFAVMNRMTICIEYLTLTISVLTHWSIKMSYKRKTDKYGIR